MTIICHACNKPFTTEIHEETTEAIWYRWHQKACDRCIAKALPGDKKPKIEIQLILPFDDNQK